MTMVEIAEVNDAEEAAIVGRAIKVASALSARHTDEFAKPGNLVEVRFVTRHSLTASVARRERHLLPRRRLIHSATFVVLDAPARSSAPQT